MNRRIRKITWVVVLVMGLVAAYRLVTVKPRPAKDYVKSPRPLNMAHQGGAGLAPSNTIVAFRNALKVGADGLELDVHATKDGEVVVTHDDTVDRTTDGTGAVKDFTLAELKKLDAGYRFTPDNGQTYPYRGQGITIPTLREVLAEFPDQRINIEIKQSEPPIESKVLEVIDEMGMRDMVLVVSFDDAVMKWFREMAGDIAVGATENEIRTFVIYSTLKALPFYAPYANAGLKDLLHIPRPSDPRIKQVIEVTGYAFPSGHAQSRTVTWGYLAGRFRKGAMWAVAVVLPLLVALSRVYQGVQYPQDVVGGAMIGVLFILAFSWALSTIEERGIDIPLAMKLAAALLVPLALLALHATDDTATPMGTMLGMGMGIVLEGEFGGFDSGGVSWKRVVRFFVGIAVALGSWVGLKAIFPAGIIFRLIRYTIVGFWVAFFAPWLLVKTFLARRKGGIGGLCL